MKTNKLMLSVVGLILLFTVAAASAADAPKLTFQFKTTNVPGALQTFPNARSDQSVTVGQYEDKRGNYHGYILKGKKVKTLNDPNGSNTGAYDINLNYNGKGDEMVVGTYYRAGVKVGFLYNAKTRKFKDIKGPNGDLPATANGINDARDIVGGYDYSGFLLEGGNYVGPMNVPGATETYAQGIDNSGDIVLAWLDSSGAYHGAFTINNGVTYTIIDVPNAGPEGGFPDCIDNHQDVTFTWYDSRGLEHGALCTTCLTNPQYQTFDYPKAYQTNAACVNDKKTIVGYYLKRENSPYWSGFKATYK
jgi:hypothetical protein